MSPFPQSVAYSSTSPAVFPSPPAVVQVVVVSTRCSRSISNGHAGSADKVF